MTRRKATAIDAPGSYAEALKIAALYGAAERRAAAVKARSAEMIANLCTERDEIIAAIDTEQKPRFAQLKAWWAVQGGEAAKGARSLSLGGVKLGERMSNPKVGYLDKMKEQAALAKLKGLRWLGKMSFIRTKVELDKPAILKALGEGIAAQAALKVIEGPKARADLEASIVTADMLATIFSANQTSEFYIDVAPAELVKIEAEDAI
jgi:phage host-nuclease inhibitor protein Gam